MKSFVVSKETITIKSTNVQFRSILQQHPSAIIPNQSYPRLILIVNIKYNSFK